MALNFAITHNVRSILTLDAFFPNADVFKLAGSVLSVQHQSP